MVKTNHKECSLFILCIQDERGYGLSKSARDSSDSEASFAKLFFSLCTCLLVTMGTRGLREKRLF